MAVPFDIGVLLTSALISIIAALYIYSRYKLNYWKRKGIEQLPDAHWIFGHFKDALFFRSPPGWHLGKLYKRSTENAKFFGFYILHRPYLQVKDPEIIKRILITDFENFKDRHFGGVREKDSIGTKNLFGLKNPVWKYVRDLTSYGLTIEKIKKMLPMLLDSGKPMMDFIDNHDSAENGVRKIDGQDLNYKYGTDVIANIGLGIFTNTFQEPDSEFAKQTLIFFHSFKRFRAMFALFFLPRLVDFIGPYLYLDMSFFKEIFWNTIQFREKAGIARGDHIDHVLKLKNGPQDSGYKFEGDNLFYQTGQFFPAVETSAISTSFTLMEIARNGDVQARARTEIKKAIDDHGWTYEAFSEMKYLEKCIYEGLRLYPAVPFLDRCALNDWQIPGTNVVIERGTRIHIAISALHRDPKHFENPDVFDPERHEKGKAKLDALMPFGIGPRMCVGSKLGLLYMKVVLALILDKYQVTYNKKDNKIVPLHPQSTFTVANHGLVLEFKKLTT